MQIEWQGISAGLAGAVAASALFSFVTRSLIRDEITQLLKSLQDPKTGFVPREVCGLQHREVQQQLVALSDYAHEAKHQLTDKTTGLEMIVRSLERKAD